MNLPDIWINRIFEKLTLTYGREFVNKWESVGLPIEDVKADWAHELGFYVNEPNAIKYAFENLPKDRPPNVLQFRDLCRQHPGDKTYVALPSPQVNKEVRDASLARLKKMVDDFKKATTKI
jgi:hypothetical protein